MTESQRAPLISLYPPSSDYGLKTAWRKIRLSGDQNSVLVEMEDIAHAMRCELEHDGERVTALRPAFVRVPMTTCAGAREPLQEVLGVPIGSSFSDFYAGGIARHNCTHMFDLAWLATIHATRGKAEREYVMEMPDDNDEHRVSTLKRDGDVVLQWTLKNSTILDPGPFAGQHLFQGFTSWAVKNFSGDELEAILVFQKGCFVAQSRRFVLPSGALSLPEQQATAGICHGYGRDRIAIATRPEGTRRDFTDHPERLLRFL
jgi:hypothetical protein